MAGNSEKVQGNLGYKILSGKALTDADNKGVNNEAEGSFISTPASKIFAKDIDISPTQAVSDGVALLYNDAKLRIDPTSNGHAYFATTDTLINSGSSVLVKGEKYYCNAICVYDGVTYPIGASFQAGSNLTLTSGSVYKRITDWIEPKFGQNYLVQPKDTGATAISIDDAKKWIFQYESGIYFQEVVTGTTPASIKGYQYVGNFLDDELSNITADIQIQDDGNNVTKRPTLNFTGAVSVTDDAVNQKTQIDITPTSNAGDLTTGVLDNAVVQESNVTQHTGAIDHDSLLNYDVTEHRIINDSSTSSIELWSSEKISQEIAGIVSGVENKEYVATSTEGVGNITLSGEQTINGVTTNASRILVLEQSSGAENGIYVTASGAWTRATDFDSNAEVGNGATTAVNDASSTVYRHTYLLTTPNPITLGTTVLSFSVLPDLSFGTTAGTITEGDDSRLPTQDENDALVGTSGTPSSTNKYVTNSDSRLSDLRQPTGSAGGDLIGTYPNPTVKTATTSLGGKIILATQTEVNTGTDLDKAVTPSTLENKTYGTFTGSTISDNATLKVALQELETRVENAVSNVLTGNITATGDRLHAGAGYDLKFEGFDDFRFYGGGTGAISSNLDISGFGLEYDHDNTNQNYRGILNVKGATGWNIQWNDVNNNIKAIDGDTVNTGIKVTDSVNNKGLFYAGDYESQFVARSLVTKQYVDSQGGANLVDAGYVPSVNSGATAYENSPIQTNSSLVQMFSAPTAAWLTEGSANVTMNNSDEITLYVENDYAVTVSYAAIFKNKDNSNTTSSYGVKIETDNASHQTIGLHIVSSSSGASAHGIQIEDGSEANGRVLMCDGDGKGTWTNIPSQLTFGASSGNIPHMNGTVDDFQYSNDLRYSSGALTVGDGSQFATSGEKILIDHDGKRGIKLVSSSTNSVAVIESEATTTASGQRGFHYKGTQANANPTDNYGIISQIRDDSGTSFTTLLGYMAAGYFEVQTINNAAGEESVGVYGRSQTASAGTNLGGFFQASNSGAGDSYALRLEDGNEATGKVLKCVNAQGDAEWQDLSAVNDYFVSNESELVTAYSSHASGTKGSRIFITNDITLTANRVFAEDRGTSTKRLEINGIGTQIITLASYTLTLGGRTEVSNIQFRHTTASSNPMVKALNGVFIARDISFAYPSIVGTDYGTPANPMTNIELTGTIVNNTMLVDIDGVRHSSHQSSTLNNSGQLQPLTISNTTSSISSTLLYIIIHKFDALQSFQRFASVLVTSTNSVQLNCAGDESWYWDDAQDGVGQGNVAAGSVVDLVASANILRLENSLDGISNTDAPVIGASGGYTNTNIELQPKGAGKVTTNASYETAKQVIAGTNYGITVGASTFTYDADDGMTQDMTLPNVSGTLTATLTNFPEGVTHALVIIGGTVARNITFPTGWWIGITSAYDFSTLGSGERLLMTISRVNTQYIYGVSELTQA